jgi:xanthine dehydrogenase accessory factor
MRSDLLARAEELRASRTPYVLATVVRAERPTSAKPGDRALVLPGGELDGFVGGTCAESTVRRQGLRLLETGASTLLRITPMPDSDGPDEPDERAGPDGMTVVNNACLSGGSLEIFLESVMPAPLVHVHGDGPVAHALLRIGSAVGYDMVVADAGTRVPEDIAAVVIASHGRGEEPALLEALRAQVPYIALVASRRRGEVVLTSVGATADRVHSPAGLDIGARTPAEVAVSILAESIATRSVPVPAAQLVAAAPGQRSTAAQLVAAAPGQRSTAAPAPTALPLLVPQQLGAATGSAVDPVCGMSVTIGPDALTLEHAGQAYYFCGSGCKAAFASDPHRYLAHA